ncbi:WhiB family transcriptional regulator [Streptomyces hydrogenans]|uniref:WhiB family transcriptional regulator n=1 Tax=Streptomyces hydrogenans TaxID=1873719 RepID=UPI0035E1680D
MTSESPCSADPDLWFSTREADQTKAVAICGSCPAQAECAQYATSHGIRWGTWGGLTEAVRRSPRKRPAKSDIPADCGTSTAFWRHVNNKEACTVCDAWHAADLEADRRRALAEEHAKGGTRRGYEIHRRLGEQTCEPCRRAHAQMLADRRRKARGDHALTAHGRAVVPTGATA